MEENEKYGIELTADTHYFKNAMKELGQFIKAFGRGMKESFVEQTKEIATNFKESFKNIRKVDDVTEETTEQFEEMNETTKETSSSLNNLFDKSISKIKRFTYYLLGARSVFSLFMRYRSIYYQYNEEMQYQSELSQNAIALSLAPAFEFLSNVIAYASIGLAKFIELLTGVNVLSKVTTKGIRDYNKSLKETQTLVSGIDEITNLTNPQTLGLADQYSALKEFRDKIAEVEEFFKNNEWITKLADGLKQIWQFLKENIWPILEDTIFPIVKDIFEFIYDIFETIIDIFDQLNLFEYVVKPVWRLIKAIFHTAEFLVEAIADIFTLDWDGLEKDFDDFVKKIKKDFDIGDVEVDFKVNNRKDFEDLYNQLTYIKENGGGLTIQFKDEKQFQDFQKYVRDTKKDADLLENSLDFTSVINDDNKTIERFMKKIDDWEIEKKFIEVGLKYNIPKATVQDLINKARYISVDILRMDKNAFNNMANNILKKFGYAKGLDYVPYDNYPALLHKGEAVVPAKYNPTIHSQGNEYTNSLLETLIYKVEDLANRPNVFEIDGQKFAQATYSLYDDQRKNQSYVEGVVR